MRSAFIVMAACALTGYGLSAAVQKSIRVDGSDVKQLTDSQFWSDAGAVPWPNPNDDYILVHGIARGPNSAVTFNGHSFQMGEVGGGVGQIATKEGLVTFANEGLILANGRFDHWSQNNERWINGKVKVISPAAKPFLFTSSHENSSNGHALGGPISGDSTVAIKASTQQGKFLGYRFRAAGDLSNYYGTFLIDDDVPFTCGNNTEAHTCPGTITLGKRTTLILPYVVSDLSIANISFDVGSALHIRVGHDGDLPTSSALTVTKSLAMPSTGKVRIELNDTMPVIGRNAEAPKYEVLKVAKSVREISANEFEVAPENAEVGLEGNALLPKCAKPVLDVSEDGMQTLSVQPNRIVTFVTNDAGGQSAFLPKDASHWWGMKNGEPLSPDVDYYVENGQIRSPEGYPESECVFRGNSLTFNGGYLILKTPQTTISNLTVRSGVTLANWGGGEATDEVKGGWTTLNGRMAIAYKGQLGEWWGLQVSCQAAQGTTAGRGMRINSDITGSCYVHFNAAYDGSIPFYELGGDNSNFGGSIIVQADDKHPTCSPVLIVSDGRNLGGPVRKTSDWMYAVWLRDGGCLRAIKTMAVTEPTRGVYVNGDVRLQPIEGVTLTIDGSPITLNGTLRKVGKGTLAVGGALHFGKTEDNAQSESPDPIPGKNLVKVEEGHLQVLSTGCLARSKISFGEKGVLAVGLPKADGDAAFAKYGAVLTANDEPFDAAEVPVTVEGDAAAFGEESVSVPVFTVTKAAAANLKVRPVKPAKGYRLAVEMRENPGENSVTCWATVEITGMAVIFR